MTKLVLTVKEVAELLGVSTTTIYTMARENEVPHFKIRGRIMFNRDLVESWTRGEHEMKEQGVM